MQDLLKSIENVRNQGVKPADIPPKPRCLPLLCPTIYFLNKSRTKYVCVGLNSHSGFSPTVQVSGLKNDCITFDGCEWEQLLLHQLVISNYLWGAETRAPLLPIKINGKTIYFQCIGSKKIIKIQEQGVTEVFLGWESVAELWELLPIIRYRLEILQSLEFHNFYSSLVKGVAGMSGDMRTNIDNVISPLRDAKSENACCMMEMVKFGRQVLECDVQMEAIEQTVNFEN